MLLQKYRRIFLPYALVLRPATYLRAEGGAGGKGGTGDGAGLDSDSKLIAAPVTGVTLISETGDFDGTGYGFSIRFSGK